MALTRVAGSIRSPGTRTGPPTHAPLASDGEETDNGLGHRQENRSTPPGEPPERRTAGANTPRGAFLASAEETVNMMRRRDRERPAPLLTPEEVPFEPATRARQGGGAMSLVPLPCPSAGHALPPQP